MDSNKNARPFLMAIKPINTGITTGSSPNTSLSTVLKLNVAFVLWSASRMTEAESEPINRHHLSFLDKKTGRAIPT